MKQPQFSQHFNNQLLEQPTCGNKLNAAGSGKEYTNSKQTILISNKHKIFSIGTIKPFK